MNPEDFVDAAVACLDENDRDVGIDISSGKLLRVLKLIEEVGEVAEAIIGCQGQNPRKGIVNTTEDIISELRDVLITGLVALRTYDSGQNWLDNLWYELEYKLDRMIARLPKREGR